MRKKTFDELVKEHLSCYKWKCFPKLKHGFWTRSKPPKELKYAFVKKIKGSDCSDEDNNLIEFYKDSFLKSAFNIPAKRHMYFHHMNSSQAMCFNFFYPLYKEKKLNLVIDALGVTGEEINYESVDFEMESHIDSIDKHRPTNFDFYFKTVNGKKFYFEIKYTENDFGKAPKDKLDNRKFDLDHTNKFEAVYKKHLSNCPAINNEYKTMDMFLSHYQIMRNLIHIDDKSYVVFVYPKDNLKVKKSAENAKKEILTDRYKSKLINMEWENLLESVRKTEIKFPLKDQMNEFHRKYLDLECKCSDKRE